MNFGKVKAVFFILVFFLALALVVNAALGLDAKNHPEEEPAEEPEQTEYVPEPAQETPVPIPTWAPAPTPGPQQYNTAPTPAPQQNNTPAAAPTPVPTPTPRPSGQNLGSGGFRSETGTALNLVCDWSAVSVADNKAEITLTISIEHASIQLNDMGDNIFLRVGDQSAKMAQPIMNYDGGRTVTTVGSKTVTVPAGGSYSVAIEWHYNGSYSGVPMDVIECGGSINLS